MIPRPSPTHRLSTGRFSLRLGVSATLGSPPPDQKDQPADQENHGHRVDQHPGLHIVAPHEGEFSAYQLEVIHGVSLLILARA